MKRLLAIAIVAALVAIVWWRTRRPEHTSTIEQPAQHAAADRTAMPTPAASTATSGSAARVRSLPPEERRRLGEQIATAIKRVHAAPHAPGAAPAAGSDDVPIIPLEAVSKPLFDGLQASLPILAECYTKHAGSSSTPPPHATARMTLASDPDLGSVIDTDQIQDADGHPLPHELETCLRDAIDSLALPPLGQPGKVQLQYTFRFD